MLFTLFPLLLTNNNRKNLGVVAEGKLLPSFRELFAMLTTFTLTVFAWIFFRADNVNHAFRIVNKIFTKTLFELPQISIDGYLQFLFLFSFVFFIALEWLNRDGEIVLKFKKNKSSLISWSLYFFIFLLIFLVGGKAQDFIYFQF